MMTPEIVGIRRGPYISHACIQCGKIRWVTPCKIARGKHLRCSACARRKGLGTNYHVKHACVDCGKIRLVVPSRLALGQSQRCLRCERRARAGSLQDRFNARVDKNGAVPDHNPDLGPCHIWMGEIRPLGYGAMMVYGEHKAAHHIAFYLAHGRWPAPGKFICHHCDVKRCVNFQHLYEGDTNTNVRDKSKRGLQVEHERHPMAKLRDRDVCEIWRANRAGESQSAIARRFGVNKVTINGILHGRTWRGVVALPRWIDPTCVTRRALKRANRILHGRA